MVIQGEDRGDDKAEAYCYRKPIEVFMNLSIKTLRKFLEIAANRLEGNWVVIGGTVLPLLGSNHRGTVDIDLAGPRKASQKDTLALMEIAQELGLPVETINQAGAFFLFKIQDWEKKIIELHKGKKATFFRPNLELFLELKMGRLNESDLSDCLEFISYTHEKKESLNAELLIKKVRKEIKNSKENPAKEARLQQIIAALEN